MTATGTDRLLIEAMAKHLPPSGALLRLLDVEGRAGAVLTEIRPDLEIILSPGQSDHWQVMPDSIDAVVAYDCALEAPLLESALAALRPGGRLVVMWAEGQPGEALVRMLEVAGYTRILVEAGVQDPDPLGVLMRGEKPHTEVHTSERVRQVAARDAAEPGKRHTRYVHLLIRQKPNKPAWKVKAGEKIEWHAVAVAGENETVILAFSSLPKAVEFMQPAVLAGRVNDVTKVAKFRWDVVQGWPFPVMLNPSDELLDTHTVTEVEVDPASAEASDE